MTVLLAARHPQAGACTVRQQSEDKAYHKLQSLKPLKTGRPDLTVAVMGCVVGVRGNEALEKRFPFVDVFMEPSSDGLPLIFGVGWRS